MYTNHCKLEQEYSRVVPRSVLSWKGTFTRCTHLHAQTHVSTDVTNMKNHDVQKYIFEVRQSNIYASEAYTFNLGDTKGEHTDIIFAKRGRDMVF